MLKIKSRSALCKSNTLPSVLSLRPPLVPMFQIKPPPTPAAPHPSVHLSIHSAHGEVSVPSQGTFRALLKTQLCKTTSLSWRRRSSVSFTSPKMEIRVFGS